MADDKNFKALVEEQKKNNALLLAEQKKTNRLLENEARGDEKGTGLKASLRNSAGEIINDIVQGNRAKREADETQKMIEETAKTAAEQRDKNTSSVIEEQAKSNALLIQGPTEDPSKKKEDKKDRLDAFASLYNKSFKGLFNGLKGFLKNINPLKGTAGFFGTLLKLGAGGIALMLLSKFLNDPTWKKWKEDLIPALVTGIESIIKLFSWLIDKTAKGFKSIKALSEGDFSIENIKDSLIGITAAFVLLSTALLPVAGLLLPRLVFGGLMKGGKWLIAKPFIAAFKGLGRALGLGGSGMTGAATFGPAKASFWQKTVQTVNGIFSSLKNRFTSLATQVKSLAPKFGTSIVNTLGSMFTGIKDRIAGLASKALKIGAPAVKVATSSIAGLMGSKNLKGAGSKVVKSLGGFGSKIVKGGGGALKTVKNVGQSLTKKFPNFGK